MGLEQPKFEKKPEEEKAKEKKLEIKEKIAEVLLDLDHALSETKVAAVGTFMLGLETMAEAMEGRIITKEDIKEVFEDVRKKMEEDKGERRGF